MITLNLRLRQSQFYCDRLVVCQILFGVTLHFMIVVEQNCSVGIEATEDNGYMNDSWVAVYIAMSDISRSVIEINGGVLDTDQYLSYVEVQVSYQINT